MVLWLFFRQQSEAELPMPGGKRGRWDFGPSPRQGTFPAPGEPQHSRLTAEGLLGVIRGRDAGAAHEGGSSQPQYPVAGQTLPRGYVTPISLPAEGKLRQRWAPCKRTFVLLPVPFNLEFCCPTSHVHTHTCSQAKQALGANNTTHQPGVHPAPP